MSGRKPRSPARGEGHKPRSPARGKGEGSIYQRADGYWVGQVENGRYPNGRRRYARAVRRYKSEVLKELPELKRQADEGIIPDRSATVATYLDFWINDVKEGEVTSDSLDDYKVRLRRVKPHIGHHKLYKLSPPHIQALSTKLVHKYPNSKKTVSQTLETLRSALRWAVAAGMISKNPAEHVKTPKMKVVKVDDALTADEARAVLKAAEGHRRYALVWLAVKYGLRIGELLSLRWSDVDVAKGEMTVPRSATKSDAGHRTLPLIEDASTVLREHRTRQAVASLDGYVFTNSGPQLKPQRVRQEWSDLLAEAGIKHLCRNCAVECTHGAEDQRPCRECRCSSSVRRFHVSRHTAATLLLESGVSLEVVSAILGHANLGITADIYAKVRSDLKRQGLDKLA